MNWIKYNWLRLQLLPQESSPDTTYRPAILYAIRMANEPACLSWFSYPFLPPKALIQIYILAGLD